MRFKCIRNIVVSKILFRLFGSLPLLLVWRWTRMVRSWGTMPLAVGFSMIITVLLLVAFLVILDLFRFLNLGCLDLFMPWKLLITRVGWIYGLRGTRRALYWSFGIMILFRGSWEIVGQIVLIMIYNFFCLMFFVRVTLVRCR